MEIRYDKMRLDILMMFWWYVMMFAHWETCLVEAKTLSIQLTEFVLPPTNRGKVLWSPHLTQKQAMITGWRINTKINTKSIIELFSYAHLCTMFKVQALLKRACQRAERQNHNCCKYEAYDEGHHRPWQTSLGPSASFTCYSSQQLHLSASSPQLKDGPLKSLKLNCAQSLVVLSLRP